MANVLGLLGTLWISNLCLLTDAETFRWYEREYTRSETELLLESADKYWSMNDDNNIGQGSINDGGGLVKGPVKNALKSSNISTVIADDVSGCYTNPDVFSTDDAGFAISVWYSLRPDGDLDYNQDACGLLSIGNHTKIKFEGGAEHNLSFAVRINDSHSESIHISKSNMPDPRYDVCLRWNSTTQACDSDDNEIESGWQWNHVVLVYNKTTGLKAYFNTFELANIERVEQTPPQSASVGATTILTLNPDGGCHEAGFDEIALWSSPLTQDEVAILRLGPFANGTESTTTTEPTSVPTTSGPTTSGPTTKMVTVNVAEERDSINRLAQDIDFDKTPTEAGDILTNTRGILTQIVPTSQENYEAEDAEIADEIVNTGASIVKSVASLPIFTDSSTTKEQKKEVRQQCLDTIDVSSNLANQISYSDSSKKTETALKLEEAITSVLNTYLEDTTAPNSETVTSPNVELRFEKIDTSSNKPVKLEFSNGGGVEIESAQYATDNSEARLVVAGIGKSLQDLLPTTVADGTNSNTDVEYAIAGTIYNVVLGGSDGSNGLGVKLEIDTDLPATDGRLRHCTFLDLTKTPSEWSTDGLTIDPSSTEKRTICKSTHLTNFAILMSVNDVPLTKAQEVSLNLITYIGCSLSLLCLTITIILLFVLRDLQRSTRISILKHLAISMFIAQLLFLSGVEPALWNKHLCTAVAAFLHYFFLAVMCWMLTQGVYLYLKLRRSAQGTWKFVYFCLIGWGLPAILVCIVAGIKHDAYGTEAYCWLSTEDGVIWAFVGPALAIIAVNTIVMLMAMNAFTSVKVFKDKSDKEKMRSSLRAVVVMLPILGLTWIFGVFSFNQETIFFQYIFATLNSLQGVFLFIFNVLWNDEVKSSLRRKLGRTFGSEESSMFFNRVLGSASVAPTSKGTETSSIATVSASHR